ncbi:MAG: DegV family protein [Firmicutes bacterium]|nr:DegV family protein [Bacillota bacterium]MDY3091279.1 DegV family protein [Erysipelotrichaceae bacterium]
MVQILSDSSTLYSVSEGKDVGLVVVPLSVQINNKSYREFEDISSKEFLKIIAEGHIPTSSQPSIGEKEEAYNAVNGEVIDLTMADGLSGTYQSAMIAKDMSNNPERIHVINTRTLCGPHRYIVNKALKLASEGKGVKEILSGIENSINVGRSFLIPYDFAFLKRGGRLSPLAATLGGLLRIIPILELSEDGKSLLKFGVKKTYKKAVMDIIEVMKNDGVDDSYDVSISHAGNDEWTDITIDLIKKELGINVSVYDLSPAFITQGGPGCVAIQYCKK